MSGISIQGIRIKSLSLDRDNEKGGMKVTGSYELVTTAGIVIAKQGFGGYGDITLAESAETAELKHKLIASFQSDINKMMGL